ncbi:putative ABC transport system ATP-binding protein [Sporobacter termitidis DSM 10068]|uniref:Putative ABC transport system ATP-binding protein n=2 Tax=Sporobacter TaxID=44748 RepID=A0A1M5XTN4_9FIRM|nr:ABC transporter ATP-binding protein [Sporobacter termitidis]SHI03109.1 putative ABC transport system ATP-binding protein [Sporobacter termitidis DSM 10068]
MLLEIEGLTKEYTRGGKTFPAVERAELSVGRGDFVSIIGRSGSGKSTLLNMIAGFLPPTSGSIKLEGADLYALKDKEISALRNARLGYIPQGAGALSNLTVFDNIRLPYFLSRRQGDASGRASFLLDEVGISPLAGMLPSQLSGGELRRVLIARALMNEPDILIADEPTSDLDIETTGEIMELLARINKNGTTVLLVTHELDTLKFGNRVLTMAAGRLTEE